MWTTKLIDNNWQQELSSCWDGRPWHCDSRKRSRDLFKFWELTENLGNSATGAIKDKE